MTKSRNWIKLEQSDEFVLLTKFVLHKRKKKMTEGKKMVEKTTQ